MTDGQSRVKERGRARLETAGVVVVGEVGLGWGGGAAGSGDDKVHAEDEHVAR